jgi:alpha-amylase
MFGIGGPQPREPLDCLPVLIKARKSYAWGNQRSYFDNKTGKVIGWTREGVVGLNSMNEGKPGCAILISTSLQVKSIKMFVGLQHSASVWIDLLKGSLGALESSENLSNLHTDGDPQDENPSHHHHPKFMVKIDADGYGTFAVGPRGVGVWVKNVENIQRCEEMQDWHFNAKSW